METAYVANQSIKTTGKLFVNVHQRITGRDWKILQVGEGENDPVVLEWNWRYHCVHTHLFPHSVS